MFQWAKPGLRTVPTGSTPQVSIKNEMTKESRKNRDVSWCPEKPLLFSWLYWIFGISSIPAIIKRQMLYKMNGQEYKKQDYYFLCCSLSHILSTTHAHTHIATHTHTPAHGFDPWPFPATDVRHEIEIFPPEISTFFLEAIESFWYALSKAIFL